MCRGQLAGLTSPFSAEKSDHAVLTVYLFHKRGQVGREPAVVAQTAGGQQACSPIVCWLRLGSCVEGAFAQGGVLDFTIKSESFPVWGFCDVVLSLKPGDGG